MAPYDGDASKETIERLVAKVSALHYVAPEPAYDMVWHATWRADVKDNPVALKQIIAELLLERGK